MKLSVDLGRGEPFEIISNAPINYDQWHKVIVDRRGHYVTLTVKSEEGVGEVTEDKVNIGLHNPNFDRFRLNLMNKVQFLSDISFSSIIYRKLTFCCQELIY